MRSHLIESVECDVTGHTGWVFSEIRRLPDVMMIANSANMAHDIVEHCNGLHNIGSVNDELEAFGALWFVRCETGVFSQPEITLAKDLQFVFEHALNDSAPYRCVDHKSRHKVEDFIDSVIEEAIPFMADSLREYEREPDDFMVDLYIQDAKRLMSVGYRKAKKRWRLNWQALEQFQAIERALKPFDGKAEDRLNLKLTWGGGRATAHEVWGYDW